MAIPSMPTDENITPQDAIQKIIVSIAMEEMGLSQTNAEGEKLRHVLGTLLGESRGTRKSIEQVLQVNRNIDSLLNDLTRTQVQLKAKLDRALEELDMARPPVGPTGPTGPTGATGAPGEAGQCNINITPLFNKCEHFEWRQNEALPFVMGECTGGKVSVDPQDCTKIWLEPGYSYLISYAINVFPYHDSDASVVLCTAGPDGSGELFTHYQPDIPERASATLTASGLYLSTMGSRCPITLRILLRTPRLIRADSYYLTVQTVCCS